jgi:glutamate-ammonia-ligase adenylyltransferase
MRVFRGARDTADDARLAAALRELRVRVWLRVAARELAGLAPLAQVVGTMATSPVALEAAHRHHRAARGGPRGAAGAGDLLVVGMGKLGGRELNVSSDIDLVFVHPEEGQTAGPRALSNQEFFVRLGQRIIRTLADVTPEGFVFRVDMRLRPWGDAGALASSFDALEQYLVAHGREWERYAWIKARVVTGGDAGMADGLERIVRPFVYRKYLDYGSIDAVRHLHAQIRAEVARRELADDVKLGPGGIREIEFIARRSSSSAAATVPTSGRPSAAVLERWPRSACGAAAADELAAAYVFLRRRSIVCSTEDQQTHGCPPPSPTGRSSPSMGHADVAAATLAAARDRDAPFGDVFAAAAEPNQPRRCGSDARGRRRWAT